MKKKTKKKYRKKWRMTIESNGRVLNVILFLWFIMFLIGAPYTFAKIYEAVFKTPIPFYNWRTMWDPDEISYYGEFSCMLFWFNLFLLSYRFFGYAMNDKGIYMHNKHLKTVLTPWEDLKKCSIVITNAVNPHGGWYGYSAPIGKWRLFGKESFQYYPWISFYGEDDPKEVFREYAKREQKTQLDNLSISGNSFGFIWPGSYKGLWPDALLEDFDGEIYIALSVLVGYDKAIAKIIEKYHIPKEKIHVLKDCENYELVREGEETKVKMTYEIDTMLLYGMTDEERRARMTEDEKKVVDQYTIN